MNWLASSFQDEHMALLWLCFGNTIADNKCNGLELIASCLGGLEGRRNIKCSKKSFGNLRKIVWWTRVRVKVTAAVFIYTTTQLEDIHAKRRMCFWCYKLDTLSHIINLSRDFSDAHMDLSRMCLRDSVGNAKSHSLEPMTLWLDVLEGRRNIQGASY